MHLFSSREGQFQTTTIMDKIRNMRVRQPGGEKSPCCKSLQVSVVLVSWISPIPFPDGDKIAVATNDRTRPPSDLRPCTIHFLLRISQLVPQPKYPLFPSLAKVLLWCPVSEQYEYPCEEKTGVLAESEPKVAEMAGDWKGTKDFLRDYQHMLRRRILTRERGIGSAISMEPGNVKRVNRVGRNKGSERQVPLAGGCPRGSQCSKAHRLLSNGSGNASCNDGH